MAFSSGNESGGPMAEINVTPLVDVMLVLLIIFMVAAPLMTAGVPLSLPETAANAVPNEDEEPLMVSIPVEGSTPGWRLQCEPSSRKVRMLSSASFSQPVK